VKLLYCGGRSSPEQTQVRHEDKLFLLADSYLHAGSLALDAAKLIRPASADRKRHGKLDTSAAKEALTALENKQMLEKRIEHMTKENSSLENDILRLHAKLAETEHLSQSKTATFEERIATLLDENESLKADFLKVSKIPREKLLLWALKEKESAKQPNQQMNPAITHPILPLPHDASKPERNGIEGQEERKCSAEAHASQDQLRKLEMELKESKDQLLECQDRLRSRSEELLLMQLRLKEGGTQQVKQSDMNTYVLKLEETITSLSEELSSLKQDLISAKDDSRQRMDEISSQLLLRHQKRFLSDRNDLIATHGKLMLSMARMSGGFSSEIRAQLVMLRENVSKTKELLESDVAGAIQELERYVLPKSALQQNQQVIQKFGVDNVGILSPTLDQVHQNALVASSGPKKKEKSFFSSLFGKVSQSKGDVFDSSTIVTEKTSSVPVPAKTASATAHLKTVFAQAKGAVEAKEAIQSRLSAEAHAQALSKIEEEWAAAATAKLEAEARAAATAKLEAEARAAATAKLEAEARAAATAKLGAESRKLHPKTTITAQTSSEPNITAEVKTAAHVTFTAEVIGALKSKSSSSTMVKTASKVVSGSFETSVRADADDADGYRNFSDVSSLSDHRESPFGNEDSDFERHAVCDESIHIAQSIIAATFAMNKPPTAASLNSTEDMILTPPRVASSMDTKVSHQSDGRKKLQDRPASAEMMRSGFLPSEQVKVSFLNDAVYEDAADSSLTQHRGSSTVAEKSGRKILAGTSKSVLDTHQSAKVRSCYGASAFSFSIIMLSCIRRHFWTTPKRRRCLMENLTQWLMVLQYQPTKEFD
jgi:hypothetical protein